MLLARFWKNSSRCVCFSSAFFTFYCPTFLAEWFFLFLPNFLPIFCPSNLSVSFQVLALTQSFFHFLVPIELHCLPELIWSEPIWSELIWSELICSQNCQILALVLLLVLVLPNHQNFYQTAQVLTCYGFIAMIAHLPMWAEWKWGRWNIAFLPRSLILILNTAGDFVQVKICKISIASTKKDILVIRTLEEEKPGRAWHLLPPSQVPQPTCFWKWHSWQLGNLTRHLLTLLKWIFLVPCGYFSFLDMARFVLLFLKAHVLFVV